MHAALHIWVTVPRRAINVDAFWEPFVHTTALATCARTDAPVLQASVCWPFVPLIFCCCYHIAILDELERANILMKLKEVMQIKPT